MKILEVRSRETNEHYDPENARNGGGYSQPEIVITFDDGRAMIIQDTSCGEFGTRIRAGYYATKTLASLAACYYGSMVDVPDSSFLRFVHGGMLRLVREATGYNIPTMEDIDEEEAERDEEEYEDWDEDDTEADDPEEDEAEEDDAEEDDNEEDDNEEDDDREVDLL